MKKAPAVVLAVVVLCAVCISVWSFRHARPAPAVYEDPAAPATATVARRAPMAGRTSQRLANRLAQAPLGFEENRGQFDRQVKFATRGANYGLFLSAGQATIVHRGNHRVDSGEAASALATAGSSEIKTTSVSQLTWIGANPNAQPKGLNRQRGESNYIIGKDAHKWRRHVPHYDRVQLTGLYPGIDLAYRGAEQQVEFDYIIAPHADPSEIQVGIDGPSMVALDAGGQLSISSNGDKMLLLPPVAYQEKAGKREIVEAHYALEDSHRFGFHLGPYDASRPLVIDPVLSFAASFGPSSNATDVGDVVLDSNGNIYITGTTCDTNYPTTSGALQPSGGSIAGIYCYDAIVTKFDPTGSTLLYSTYIGGLTGVDFAVRMLADAAGEVTLTGATASTDFPTTAGAYQSTLKDGTCDYSQFLKKRVCTDAFLLKLSADGSNLIYSTLYGGERIDVAIALAQDSAGNSYIAGNTNSATLPLAGSPYQSTYAGGSGCQGGLVPCFNGFVAKFNPTGTQLLAATYLGGSLDDFVSSLAFDPQGNLYVAGSAASTNFPTTPGSIQTTHGAGTNFDDAFLAKMDSSLHTLQYSTLLGGGNDDIALALRVDSAGVAYITGSTLSSDFPTTSGAYQTTYKGPTPTLPCAQSYDYTILNQPTCGDVFVAKIDPSKPSGSQLVFSTLLGGSSNDFAYNLALDSQKNIWLIGDSDSTDFPFTPDAYFAPSAGGVLFLSEIKSDGSKLLFSTSLSGGGGGLAPAIAIDSTDNVYVAGQGMVSPTAGTYSFDSPGAIFLAKYSPGTEQPAVQLSANSLNFQNTVTNSASPAQSVTLTNTGTGALHPVISVSADQIGVGNPQVFSETDNCPASLAAGASCTINAIYLPSTPGNLDSAVIKILDDAPGAPHIIGLSGTNGFTVATSFLPSILSFPGQQPGVTSASQTSALDASSATASNIFAKTTSVPVLSGPNASEFALDETNCQTGTFGCTVTATFTPAASATGTRTATLTVTTNAPNSPHTLQLTGTVSAGPYASLLPVSPITLNTTTVGQTLNTNLFVKNTGGANLTISAINVTGANAGDFSVTAGSCAVATTIAPQSACYFNLAFTPSAHGNRTATITLADNETTPASTTVTGVGADSGGPRMSSEILGSSGFSDTTVGQNTSLFPMTVLVSNFGSGASSSAHVTSVTVTGDFQQQTTGVTQACIPPYLLTGGSSCTINVIFAPTAAGQRTGTLTIQTDAPGTPSFTYNLSGNGILTGGVALTPANISFGKQPVGSTSSAQMATLKNTGNGTLNISGLAISGAFSQTTTCGATLAPGASCTFSVKFSPTASGSDTGKLSFAANAAGQVFAVGLSGAGVTGPVAQASPAALTFGNQAIGTVSPAQAVTFSNVGDTAFSFSGVHASENFEATSNCPSSMAAGASCTINVSFTPTTDTFQGGPTAGGVFVTTNAPNSPLKITVSGVATASTGAATTATITSSLNPSTVGQSVTFTATITSTQAGTPTGTVTFYDGGTPLAAAVPLNAQAKAAFTTSTLAQGNHSIFCTYSGDATFAPTTSSGISQTVNASTTAATTTTVVSSLNPSTTGQNVTFTASVSSTTAGTITGTVTFFDGATQLGNPATLGGGKASYSTTTLSQGSHSITAKYSGDTNYSASTSAALTQTVNATAKASTTTTVASSLNPSTTGASVTFTATVSSTTAGTITGTVTFLDGATSLGTGSVGNGGKATFSTTALAQGSHSITAQYGGDATFAASTSAALTQTVNATTKASTTTALVSSHNPSASGASVTFTATVSSSTAGTITGTVTFLDGAASLGTGSVGAGGVATYSTTTLSAGSHSITAQYGGDSNFAPSTSSVITQVVNAAADFSVSANPNALTIVAGQTGTVALTVTPQDGSTQTVSFSCTGLPSASSCSFVPASVTLDGTHAASTQVTLSTTMRTSLATPRTATRRPMLPGVVGLAAVCLAMILFLLPTRTRRASWRLALALLVLAAPISLVTSCAGGSGSGGGGTPAGTTQISVVAVSGSDTHSATVTVTVK